MLLTQSHIMHAAARLSAHHDLIGIHFPWIELDQFHAVIIKSISADFHNHSAAVIYE